MRHYILRLSLLLLISLFAQLASASPFLADDLSRVQAFDTGLCATAQEPDALFFDAHAEQPDEESTLTRPSVPPLFRWLGHYSLSSADGTATCGSVPAYQLVNEFQSASIYRLARQTIPLCEFRHHWLGKVSSSRIRIAGWKDGNLFYAHEYPMSKTFS
ncbi:hypothetical protein [Vibrio proteolyticus]